MSKTSYIHGEQSESDSVLNATAETSNSMTKARLLQVMRRVGHSM